MLAGSTATNHSMPGAAEALYLSISVGMPVWFCIKETFNVFLSDIIDAGI
jgi:hypothetical protein